MERHRRLENPQEDDRQKHQATGSHLGSVCSVASLGGGPPRVTPSRGDTRSKISFLLWLNLQRTLDKRRTTWKNANGEETTAKNSHHFQRRCLKKVVRFFEDKIG